MAADGQKQNDKSTKANEREKKTTAFSSHLLFHRKRINVSRELADDQEAMRRDNVIRTARRQIRQKCFALFFFFFRFFPKELRIIRLLLFVFFPHLSLINNSASPPIVSYLHVLSRSDVRILGARSTGHIEIGKYVPNGLGSIWVVSDLTKTLLWC